MSARMNQSDGHQKMQEQAGNTTQDRQQGFKPQSSAPNPGNRPKSGDYLEFEEVK